MAAPKNPVGSKSDKIWRDAIMRAVRRVDKDVKDQRLDRLADRLVKSAMEGDVSALKEVGDRLDGKPVQGIEHSGSLLEEFLDRLGRPASE